MSDKSPSLATLPSVIKRGVENRLKDLHTAMPGIVETFDPVNQTASVQPAIKRIFKTNDGEIELLTPKDLPILINVPVQFPRGGGFSLTFPVTKGDECLLVFCERSIDNWHKFSGVKEPGARRFHALSDATAFVGLSSEPNKIPNYDNTNVELKKDDGTVSIKLLTNSTIEITANTSVTIDAPLTTFTGDVQIDQDLTVSGDATIEQDLTVEGTAQVDLGLTVTGNSTLSGTVTSNGTDIGESHTHSGSPTAPDGPISNTGNPV